MRTLIAISSLAMALTPALAQKADRYPDPDLDGPRVVRIIPIVRNGFDDRWFGPAAADRWISNQPPPSDRFTPEAIGQPAQVQNAPAVISGASTALPEAVGIVPVPGNRLRHDPLISQRTATLSGGPTIRKPDQATCLRHNLRTVWSGQSWRCRK